MLPAHRNPPAASFESWSHRAVVAWRCVPVKNAPMRARSAPVALVLVLLLVLTACGSGGDGGSASGGSGATTRTVLVDYNHDEIAGSFLENYPRNVTVRPGDTVVFKQAWTGEPHTVTFGTHFDEITNIHPDLRRWIKEGGKDPFETLPKDVQQRGEEMFSKIPFAFGEDNITQNAGQPCYLDTGLPPEDPNTPCETQKQPAFNGKQSYYSSGIIPYQGEQGNRFEVKLAEDIAPGDYAYYCAVHGPGQAGVITVKPKGSEIPSQAEVNRAARREIGRVAKPLLEAKEAAERGRYRYEGRQVEHNLAGFGALENPEEVHAFVSEFAPDTINARVGEKVSWEVLGFHTISFDVPRYLPILTFAKDGKVTLNPKVSEPQGGWPGAPEEEGPPEGEGPPPEGEGPPPDGEGGEGEDGEDGPSDDGKPPAEVDAGRWDGNGFVSSGLMGDVIYSVTFDKPGRYKYACLIHPRMVGEVVVR